jgi:hypothetical protein
MQPSRHQDELMVKMVFKVWQKLKIKKKFFPLTSLKNVKK